MHTESHNSSQTEASLASSLLMQVKNQDETAWQRLWCLYSPVTHQWVLSWGVPQSETADLVQDVFLDVAQGIAGFEKQRDRQSFRRWLWTLCRFRVMTWRKRVDRCENVAGGTTAHLHIQRIPDEPPAEDSIEVRSNVVTIVREALRLAREETQPATWNAFERTALNGEPAGQVADELRLSVWAVYKARSRVLQKVRNALGDPEDLDTLLVEFEENPR